MGIFSGKTLPTRIALILLCSAALAAEEPVTLRQGQTGKWRHVERANWSRYDNGKYLGLTHRETRAFLTARETDGGASRFTGHFYVLEETLRDMRQAARGVDAVEQVDFTIRPDGTMESGESAHFPTLRNFPSFPERPVRPGDRWQGEGIRVVDPKGDGTRSRLPILVEYVFSGREDYKGEPVYRIKAKYATRLGTYSRTRNVDPAMTEANGTHDVDIIVSAGTGAVLLQLDRLDETFTYADGSTVRFRGSTATFGETPVVINSGELVAGIEAVRVPRESDTVAKKPPKPVSPPPVKPATPEPPPKTGTEAVEEYVREGLPPSTESAPFTLDSTERGLRLSVRDIRFLPDSDEILPDEAWRIDAIAGALALAKDATFLVEGHTASVGKPAGEMDLSVRRARRIVSELARRGLPEERFMFAGSGGTKPVGDNATAEGRAQNRRVEITILE